MAIRAEFAGGPMDGSGRALAVPKAAPTQLRFMAGGATPDGFVLVGVDDVGLHGPPDHVLVYELDAEASELTPGLYGQDQGTAIYRHVNPV